MAVPDFLAYSQLMAQESPLLQLTRGLQTGVQTAGQLQQMKLQEQQAQQAQQAAQQQQALRAQQIKQAQLQTGALPGQLAQQQQAGAARLNLLQHQITATKLTESQAKQTYLSNRLADLALIPASQRADAYKNIRQEAIDLGASPAELPDKYNDQVSALAQSALAKSPMAADERKFQNQVILQELANRGKVGAAMAKQTGTQLPPGARLVGSQIVTGLPTTTTAVPQAAATQAATPVGTAPGTIAPTVTPPATTTIPTLQPQPTGTVPEMTPPTQQELRAIRTLSEAQPPAAPAAQPFTITPTAAAQTAFEKAAGKQFVDSQTKAVDMANKSAQIVDDINTFTEAAPRIRAPGVPVPIATGPWTGYLAKFDPTGHGQLAIKAQNRLALNLLSMQKFGRVTNKEMSIVQHGTLNVHMQPAAWRVLAPQLQAIAKRNIEYSNFLDACGRIGIRDVGTARTIWNKFMQDNPIINKDGSVNENNIIGWQRYLTPQALKGELETPIVEPKGMIYPGSPEALKKGTQ